MNLEQLERHIREKSSFLCVGLDTDLERIPPHLLDEPDPLFAFNKAIIDATREYCVAYKPNTAFYEAYGPRGWEALGRTIDYLNETCPDHFTIADAKRGDIGNTATRYAQAFFNAMDFDAVTVAPYMGRDSVEPFLDFEGKFSILLGLTSNPGAFDFQTREVGGEMLFERVLAQSLEYNHAERLMFVVGATKAEYLERVRRVAPDHFLLIPGVGAQGGSLEEVCRYGMNSSVGILVNSSRGIIYASRGTDFAQKAAESAAALQAQMAALL